MSEWVNKGDVNFWDWGGWLVHQDDEVPSAWYGIGLVTHVPDAPCGACVLCNAWVDLDGWEAGRYDPAAELAELGAMYDVDVSGGIEGMRARLGDAEVAFLLLDSGLEDANRCWIDADGRDCCDMVVTTSDVVAHNLIDLGADCYIPPEVRHSAC